MFITPFVDREAELSRLEEMASRGFYPVLYIYGPEGCGKTRLLRELVQRLKDRDDYLVIYVDAEARGDPREIVLAAPELVTELIRSITIEALGATGKLIAALLPSILPRIVGRRVKGKKVVILVDDVARPLGLNEIESYAKRLLSLLEELYARGAASVLVAATTSESVSRRLLARHTYTVLAQVWNLPRQAFSKLLAHLGAPSEVAQESWKLLGGNPRLAIALKYHGWSYDNLIDALVRSVRASIEPLLGEHRDNLLDAVEDPDVLRSETQLLNQLTEANLVTPIDRPCLGYTPPPDKELGIGRYYAWITPAHREAVRRIAKQEQA